MLKVAILGCGTMGRIHSNAYKSIANSQVVAVCDIRQDFAQLRADEHNAKVYSDFKTMLDSEDIDMIDVCLPTYLHKEYCLIAIEAGKHVFCEKPIALSETDSLEIIAAAIQKGVKFTVGHVLRFFESYRLAAERFTEADLGPAKLIRTSRNQAFPMWSWDQWFQDYDRSGGPFVDLMIHDIDWIIKEFGDIERVYARSYQGKHEKQDHAIAVFRLRNGAIAHCEASWGYPQGSPFKMSFEIVGTKGQVEYDNIRDASVQVQSLKDASFSNELSSPDYHKTAHYMIEIKHFVDHIVDGAPLQVSGHEAHRALQVALAAKQSADTNTVVTIEREEC